MQPDCFALLAQSSPFIALDWSWRVFSKQFCRPTGFLANSRADQARASFLKEERALNIEHFLFAIGGVHQCRGFVQ